MSKFEQKLHSGWYSLKGNSNFVFPKKPPEWMAPYLHASYDRIYKKGRLSGIEPLRQALKDILDE